MAERRCTAWAVRVKYKDSLPFLAGRYWFDGRNHSPVSTALFNTRKDARTAAASKRNWYCKVQTPVRVEVIVREQ